MLNKYFDQEFDERWFRLSDQEFDQFIQETEQYLNDLKEKSAKRCRHNLDIICEGGPCKDCPHQFEVL